MSSTHNTVPTTPRASRASGRTLQKTQAELEAAQREIQLLQSELESVKLQNEELAQTNRLNRLYLHESNTCLQELQVVKDKYSRLKKGYKDLKKNAQDEKQRLELELKVKTDAINKQRPPEETSRSPGGNSAP